MREMLEERVRALSKGAGKNGMPLDRKGRDLYPGKTYHTIDISETESSMFDHELDGQDTDLESSLNAELDDSSFLSNE